MSAAGPLDHTERLKKALVALQRMQERVDALERAANEPIAVVGIGCRFPGDANGPAAFWRLLANGFDAVTEVPPSRWSLDELFDADAEAPGKMYARHGAFIRGIKSFDAHFFGMAPREALKTDPQHRLLLEVSWEALEHGGFAPDRLVGSRTGVFVGITLSDYDTLLNAAGVEAIDAYHMTGSCLNFAAGRLAYTFGLQGPTMAIDSACSSSLVAVHLACRSLQAGECSMALAGGVNAILSPERTIAACKARMLSPTGRARTFDAAADGFVRGEGCGVVVLRRLRDALAANDSIWAVIRGSAVNQDGPSSGLTVPNRLAQEAVIREALARAHVQPADIDYVEAHGTGTPLGDPIEVRALSAVLSEGRPAERPFLLGSVKTNVGHLESAAGVAGLIKVILALKHAAVPPHLHLQTLNPRVQWSEVPARIPTTLTDWPVVSRPRLASVSSFGGSGTNAHVILEAPPASRLEPPVTDGRQRILAVSARAPQALVDAARGWREQLLEPGSQVDDVCFTAANGRQHLEHRLAVVGDSAAALAEGLSAFVAGESKGNVVSGKKRRGQPRPVFVFSGQGPQWWAMGRELFERSPSYKRTIEAISTIAESVSGWSIVRELNADEASSRLTETEIAQPAIFAVQVALTSVWLEWGIEPAAVVGHSVGEIAAAHVAGVLDLESAVKVAVHRGRLMQRATGLGRMAAAALSREEAARLEAASNGGLSVAAVNGPRMVTLAGATSAIAALVSDLSGRGVYCRQLPVDYAFHTEQMTPHADELAGLLNGLRPATAKVPIVSTVTGRTASSTDFGAEYWSRNVRQPVLFAPAIAALAEGGHSVFLEIGPHPVLGSSIEQCLEGKGDDPVVVGSLVRNRPDLASLLTAAASLYAAGCTVDWSRLCTTGRRVPGPTYSWQRERYWVESRQGFVTKARPSGDRLVATRVRSPFIEGNVFEWEVSVDHPSYVRDHQIHGAAFLPATVFVEMGRSGAAEVLGTHAIELRDVVILAPLVLNEGDACSVHLQVDPPVDGRAAFRVMSSESPEHGSARLHVEGRAIVAKGPGALPLRPDEIRSSCSEQVSREAHYLSLLSRGLAFGPRFQTVAHLCRREGEALADIRAVRAAGPLEHNIDPVLLDGCIQALWAALPGDLTSKPGEAFVPTGFHAIRFERPCSDEHVLSHVRIVSGSPAADTWTADLTVATPDGTPIASILGLHVRRLTESSVTRAPEAGPADWLHQVEWVAVPATPGESRSLSGTWLVFSDNGVEFDQLRTAAASETARIVQIRSGAQYGRSTDGSYTIDPRDTAHFDRLLAELAAERSVSGIVYLWSLPPTEGQPDGMLERQHVVCGGLLHLVQACGRRGRATAETIVLVTRGARPAGGSRVDPHQAPAWGLMSVAAVEHPELGIRCVDLDPLDDSIGSALAQELCTARTDAQVAIRRGVRHVARLERTVLPARPPATVCTRLEITTRGTLENLTLLPVSRRPPGAGEVEIRVTAAGVNFRDVLNTLGMYPGNAGLLGSECVGRVVSVGEGVHHLAVGDEVVAVGEGTFCTYVNVRAALAVAAPDGMSAEAAATLPIAFLTARCALQELGRIKKGDRVLVHAAAGGVGLAAVQIAQQAGAEVFATAGSPEKHAYLRSRGVTHIMSSRSLDFAEQVLSATGGRGVDFVLNSLAGEFIPKSLSVLAPGGTFVEIGKTDIWNADKVGALRPDVAYHVLYLGDVLDRDPALGQRMLRELVSAVSAGELEPLPVRAFPVVEAAAAFRHMAQARHIGKVVLSQPPGHDDRRPSSDVRSDASYVVTGGLGALGFEIAEGLTRRGARHLTLVGRRKPSAAVAERIARLESEGVEIDVVSADLSQAAEVEALIHRLDLSRRPLGGIVHAAGVLDDGPLVQQTWARFEPVLAAKAQSAWHLHRAVEGRPLDFFVFFSSMSSVLGSPGQSNYASANAFLDGLAHARRAEGLPALSINWGPWATAGMAAGLGEASQQRWKARGLGTIAPAAGVEVFFDVLGHKDAQLAVIPMDWRQYARTLQDGNAPPLLAALLPERGERPATSRAVAVQTWDERLAKLAPAQRLQTLMRMVADQTISVLGLPDGFALDYQQGLREVGLDSLMAVELRNRLQTAVKIGLPATLAFDFPTVEGLARHLAVDVLRLELGGRDADTASPGSDEIAALSDAEAEALLRDELAMLQQMRREN